MNPSPKTVFSEITEEMFLNVVKTTSEFKIQSWKRKAEKLKSVDIFKYKILISNILLYQNKVDEALSTAESLLPIATTPDERAKVLGAMGNIRSLQIGGYVKAKEYYWEAYELTQSEKYFESYFLLATNFYFYDSRLENMRALNIATKTSLQHKLRSFKEDINLINNNKLNIEVYRDILNHAYILFYNYCCRVFTRIPIVYDTSISTIVFNNELDTSIVEILNDEMSQILVGLLDKYEYEELLKYPIIFTAEDYNRLS